MPTTPSPAQSAASRLNGARSAGPASEAGKARSALNGVRHGLCGRTFFLLPDEDPAEFRQHQAMWLAVWSPRDLHEREAALVAIRAMWREIRGDRLEAQVLTDLFAADGIEGEAERAAAKAAAFKALSTLLRYQARIGREQRQAMAALDALRQRRLAQAPARPKEPEPAALPAPGPGAMLATASPTPPTEPEAAIRPAVAVRAVATAAPSEPEPRALNRHQRRALAAAERQAQRRAA